MPDLLTTHWMSATGFALHGPSYDWNPALLWIFVGAHLAVALACYSMPLALVHFLRRRKDIRFSWIFAVLSIFLFSSGTARLLAVWNIWHADHWLEALVQGLAAVSAIVATFMVWPLIPKAVQLPSSVQMHKAIRQLEYEVAERKHAEEALRASQATLRELAAHQERIREDERKRIAREIHDELGQNLLVLRLEVSALHARTGDRHLRLQKRSAAALDYIDTTMKSIRTIMNNLRPSVLDLGLHAAIDWQVRQFEQRSGIRCKLAMSDDGISVGEPYATAVFRILQESLTNVGRHAQATQVDISLRVDERHIMMTVKDNGVGMYPGDRRKVHRFGLVGMQERVAMLDGELRIDSLPALGTMLSLAVPLQRDVQVRTA